MDFVLPSLVAAGSTSLMSVTRILLQKYGIICDFYENLQNAMASFYCEMILH